MGHLDLNLEFVFVEFGYISHSPDVYVKPM